MKDLGIDGMLEKLKEKLQDRINFSEKKAEEWKEEAKQEIVGRLETALKDAKEGKVEFMYLSYENDKTTKSGFSFRFGYDTTKILRNIFIIEEALKIFRHRIFHEMEE